MPRVWYNILMAFPEEVEPRSTTADDVRKVFDCWTRLEVLLAISAASAHSAAGPRHARAIAEALGISETLFNGHTRALFSHGLVRRHRVGKHVYFALTPAVRIDVSPGGVRFCAIADDRVEVTMFIPAGSPAMRMIASGLGAFDSPPALVVVPSRGSIVGTVGGPTSDGTRSQPA